MSQLNPVEKTRQTLLKQGQQIINLSSGNPGEFGITFPQQILEKGFQDFLKNPQYKPDPKGDLKARKAIVETYAKTALSGKISPENILLTSGTSESYFEIFKFLGSQKDDQAVEKGSHTHVHNAHDEAEILFPNPSYPLFEEIARLAGIKLNFYRLAEEKGWQIDLQDLVSKITPATKAIVLISPNNPTGSVLSEQTLKEVIKIAAAHNVAIISDEVFSEFIFDGKVYPHVAAIASEISAANESINHAARESENITIFTLSGISKTYALPGLKLSWIVVNGKNTPQVVDELERMTDTFLACNQITQTMLPTILKDGEKFLKNYHETIEKNRNLAVEILRKCPAITFHKPEGGFYLFAKIDLPTKNILRARAQRNMAGTVRQKENNLTDEQFVIELMKNTGIFVHPGYFYDYEKGLYILISYLMPAEKLKICLQKIVDFIKIL